MVTFFEKARKNAPLDNFKEKCAFCRAPPPENDEALLKAIMERAEMNDAKFIGDLGTQYMEGHLGLRMDKAKGLGLLTRAANLGDATACAALGTLYWLGEDGVPLDKTKARSYWERAAKKGDVASRANVGSFEHSNDNFRAAIKHYRIAAAAGEDTSVTNLITCFELDILRHNDLAWCLQAKDKACIEMKSEQRTEYEKYMYLKEVGDGKQYWKDRIAAALAKEKRHE